MELEGKKAVIFIEEQFNDHEFLYPYYRLLEAGVEIVLASPLKGKEYKGKYGITAISSLDSKSLDADMFDLLIIPGGFAPDFMRRDKFMVDFVSEMDKKKKIIASICHGGWMLVSGKVLNKRKATSFFGIKDDMINAGAIWVDEEVVKDNNLITSRTPADLPTFMRTIIESLR